MIRKLLRDYFSLTRGERRGVQVLSLLIILLLLLRASVPLLNHGGQPVLSQAEKEFIAYHDSLMKLDADSRIRPDHPAGAGRDTFRIFPFDPNTASLTELISLGLPFQTARTLINYRQAGGTFRRDSDLLRVYGMDPGLYARLEDYIRIESREEVTMDRSDYLYSDTAAFLESSVVKPDFELNRADSLQLLQVYGIGPVFARRIIRYRQSLGGYYSPHQLGEIYGISPAQKEELTASTYIDTSLLRKLDLNVVEAEELSRHPYLNRYHSMAIISYRNQMGPFKGRDEILENGLLPDSVYRQIRPYLYAGDL